MEKKNICYLSDPAQPHTLILRCDRIPSSCFTCKGVLDGGLVHHSCSTCNLNFHEGCHQLKPEITHPFHPFHTLILIFLHPYYVYYDDNDYASSSLGNYRKCKCCQSRLKPTYYQCSICDFSLNTSCASNPQPLTIMHQKSHDHTLTLFPRRQFHLPCDACGLPFEDPEDNVYSCLPCSYLVHKTCIYLPRVIKVTRHAHRLAFTSSLPSGDSICGVCRRAVDINYGQYSCSKECSYVIHSKCATRQDVWDGIDLEGVPEEEEEVVEPFVKIDEDTIQHFTHEHYLKFHGKDNIHSDGNNFCQACILPIVASDRFYSCMSCDFLLHETCACLPRIKHHPLHKHPLNLLPIHPKPFKPHGYMHNRAHALYKCLMLYAQGMFICDGCKRNGHGFVYKCGKVNCNFQIDVRCASLPDPLIHDCHLDDHPLYFNLTKGKCMGCKSNKCSRYFLECIECELFLGLKCATIPCIAHYKHDRHPLTLSFGGNKEDTPTGQYWCELCETTLDATKWFYSCNDCKVTLHIRCLLGSSVRTKPDHKIRVWNYEVEVAHNNGVTRPMCYKCRLRCVDNQIYKWRDKSCCTISCMDESLKQEREFEHAERKRNEGDQDI